MSRSRHLVDPELLPLLDSMPKRTVSAETLTTMRASAISFPVDPADLAVTDMTTRHVPGPEGAPDVPVLVYRPKDAADPLPCIFHIHGGGYVSGSAEALEAGHRRLTNKLGCTIISVNYRLAPETTFPGPVEDCYAALAWVFANAGELGVDTARIGVMGESAGGGLAAALALLVRDRGEYRFAFQHLIYPMIDDRTCVTPDPHPYVGEFVWTPEANVFGWTSLLGHAPGGEGVSPYAAAARAENLSGLPPTFLATGALDLFLDENLDYASRLVRAGVPVEMHVYPGAFHAFQWSPGARVSRDAARDSREALARALT